MQENIHMNYTYIDMENYPRRAHFSYFTGMAYPYAGVTVNVDITDWLAAVKKQNRPFFHSFLYAAANAANQVREFRQRILDGRIIEFERCPGSYTVALPDGTYCYCNVDTDMPYTDFLSCAKARQQRAMEQASLDDGAEALSLIFVSSLPWLSYAAIVQPVPQPADSNPRITWGKYFTQEGKTLIPVSLLCHHALVDGIHFAKFFKALDEWLAQMVREMNNGEAGGD